MQGITLESFRKFIDGNTRFILTTHETPDGDAIGSEMAMYHFLLSRKKQVRIINADPCPLKYRYLDPSGLVETLDADLHLSRDELSTYSLIILDINDINNIGQISTQVLPLVAQHIIIDHHEHIDMKRAGNVLEDDASSTCEILYKLFRELGYTCSVDCAKAIFTGIIYDTGCFIYPKTTATTYQIAKELTEAGVYPNNIYAHVYESNSITSLKLQARVLASLELYFDQRVAVQTMLKETIIETEASYEEADTIINFPLKSEQVRVSVFFKENLDGLLRCSLRSKGTLNVSEIAQRFGGGGHRTAAGFKSKFPLPVIKEKILAILKDTLEKDVSSD